MEALRGTWLIVLITASVVWAAEAVVVEDWTKLPLGSRGIPSGWKGQSWGDPAYDMTVEDNDGRRVLRVRSRNDSSTISKEIKGKVDLRETPIIEWRWKAVTLPKGGDSRRKETDDQAAQLYVVWPRFPETIRSRIIGYVWDTTAPVSTIVPSQKTATVTYVIVRSGTTDLGRWVAERRNVVEDYKKIYGEAPGNPGAVSISTDSNDTRSASDAFFGEVLFTRD